VHISALGDWTKEAFEVMPKLAEKARAEDQEHHEQAGHVIEALFKVDAPDGVQYFKSPDWNAPIDGQLASQGEMVPAYSSEEVKGILWVDAGKGWLPAESLEGVRGLSQRSISTCGRVYVDGPFGAPTQAYMSYEVIMLVGAGIGITPFASVLRHLVHYFNHHKCPDCTTVNLPHTCRMRKVYFHWVTRSQDNLGWFADCVREVHELDGTGLVELNNHVTSMADDMTSAMFRIAQDLASNRSENAIDIVSGLRGTRTHFGRPNWKKFFAEVEHEHPGATVGVFYCGPAVVAKALSEAGAAYTVESALGTRFDVHKENF